MTLIFSAFCILSVVRSIFILNILRRTSTPIINDKGKNHTHMVFKISHIEHSNNFGILAHNLDIPFFFCHNGNTLFFGIFGRSGICGISFFFIVTRTILSYFGILGYPNFNSPHLECTWNWDIVGKWDIPKKICHNEKWDMAHSGISHIPFCHNTWARKV